MERLKPTRALAFKVWWAYTWRQALAMTACAVLLVGLPMSALQRRYGPDKDLSAVSGLLSLVYAGAILLASWEVMYRLLKKRFGDVSLALVRE